MSLGLVSFVKKLLGKEKQQIKDEDFDGPFWLDMQIVKGYYPRLINKCVANVSDGHVMRLWFVQARVNVARDDG